MPLWRGLEIIQLTLPFRTDLGLEISLCSYLAVVEVGGTEVDGDVSDEHDVNNKIDHDEGVCLVVLGVATATERLGIELVPVALLVQNECYWVWSEHSRVDN